jgi:hypothetical protein
MKIYGFWLRNIGVDNGILKIDARCDYYECIYDEITMQEVKRIIREKKLKRILNE